MLAFEEKWIILEIGNYLLGDDFYEQLGNCRDDGDTSIVIGIKLITFFKEWGDDS